MRYTTFAKTGKKVSRVAFGAMGLNCAFGQFNEKDLIKSIHHSLEKGVSIIDTARTYGESERILGQALKEWSGEQPFIASKAAPKGNDENNGWGRPNSEDLAYPKGSITQSVEESLRQLNKEQLDLLQLHQYWSQYEDGPWYEEMMKLKDQGKIQGIGISLTDHRHDQGLSIVRKGLVDCVQTIINIFDPLAFDSLVPLCEEKKVAVLARCVLDEGGLTGFLKPGISFPESDFRFDYFKSGPLEEYMRRVDELKKFVPDYAPSLAALAIRYVLSHPGVTCANISMHIPEFADENIEASELEPLPENIFTEIREKHRWLNNLYEAKYFPREGGVLSATGFKD